MKYRFQKQEHLHQLSEDGKEWKSLTGTSSVVSVLSKPLSWWASGKAVELLGWLNPKKILGDVGNTRIQRASEVLDDIVGMSAKEYLDLLDKAYKNHATSLKESASKGVNLHSELENFVKGKMGLKPVREYDDRIQSFIKWSEENVEKYIASEANCYSERLWVGGVVDAVAEMEDGSLAIVDFKSSREAYPSQFLQASGYAIQIEENGLFSEDGEHTKKLDRSIEKLIVVPFGAEVVVPEVRININDYKKGFESAVNLYRLLGLEPK